MNIAPPPQDPNPASVNWPRFWPLVIGVFPFAAPVFLAFCPFFREFVSDHPGGTAVAGTGVVLVWLGLGGGVLAHSLDFWLRTLDFVVNRSYGPDLPDGSWWARLKVRLTRGGLLQGYSLPIALWTLLAGVILVFGPTRTWFNGLPLLLVTKGTMLLRGSMFYNSFWVTFLALGVLVGAGLVLAGGWLLFALGLVRMTRMTRGRLRLQFFATLFLSANFGFNLAISAWMPRDGEVRAQADHAIYPHLFLGFIGLSACLAYLACPLARWLLCGFKRQATGQEWANHDLLKRVELFVKLPLFDEALQPLRICQEEGRKMFWSAFGHNLRSAIHTPLRNPHLLVYPIAAVVLIAPSAYLNFAAFATGLFAWSVLAVAGNNDRLNTVLKWLQRLFFDGVLCGVSVVVVILAACRFWDISYVATITNSASSIPLVWFLLSIYVTLWYLKYWVGQVMGEHLLTLLGSDLPDGRPGFLPYVIGPEISNVRWVRGEGRSLQVHGTRFVVVGTYANRHGVGQAWEFYDQASLFEAIAFKQPVAETARGSGSGAAAKAVKAAEAGEAPANSAPGKKEILSPPPDPEKINLKFGLSDLRQRVQVYRVIIDGLLVAALMVFFWLRSKPDPVAALKAEQASETPFVLADALFQPADGHEKRKALVLVAASGGGTRAAVYTAAVCRGLNELGALEDVRLCSGVSGGSTAIAYLAIHRHSLTTDVSWENYAEVMCAPFIDDVLCGMLEPRLSMGTRMGALLDESFQRYLYGDKKTGSQIELLKDADTGLIFNTTLAGTERAGESPDPTQAGSRLVLTNLRTDARTFPSEDEQFGELNTEYLHFVVVNDSKTRLTTAAALSANFPPVFPNALVDVQSSHKLIHYWVTDGGANENRGTISLLYALLAALREAKKNGVGERKVLPLQIVIAEASAVSLDFSQDRGLGSALGAAEKFANELTLDLLHQVATEYYELGGNRFNVHFIPMPLVLRSRGGVGTHWRMPAFVTIANPKDQKDTRILSGDQTRGLIMDLYVSDAKRYRTSAETSEKQVLDGAWTWIEGQNAPERYRQHRKNWNELVTAFKKLGYEDTK